MLNNEAINITNKFLGGVYDIPDFQAHQNLWDSYNKAKSEKLFNLFGDKLIIEKKTEWKRAQRDIYREIEDVNLGYQIFKSYDKVWAEVAEGWYPWYRNEQLSEEEQKRSKTWDTLRHAFSNHTLSLGQLQHDYVAYHPETGKKITLQKGSKPMKALKNFISDKEVLNQLQIKYSQIMNTKTIKGTLCISIHPLDYLTASVNRSGWSSCYDVEDGGCWQASTLSLLTSPNTIIAYLKADEDCDLVGYTRWNNKKWRTYITLNEFNDLIHIGKNYPYKSESIEDAVMEMVAELTKENYGDKRENAGRCVLDAPSNMYNDAEDSDFTTYITENWAAPSGSRNIEIIDVSPIGAICPICGDYYDDVEFSITCSSCYRGDKCEHCGCALGGDDGTYVDAIEGYVCECCLGDHYYYCEECAEYLPADDVEEVHYDTRHDGGQTAWYGTIPYYYTRYECSHCIDRNIERGAYVRCPDCGKLVSTDSTDEECRCLYCQNERE